MTACWQNTKSNPSIPTSIISMKKGGKFIFNTFSICPPRKPAVLQYEAENGEDIVEVYYLVDGMVHHFQGRTGFEPHVTKFRWVRPDEFYGWLKSHFEKVAMHGEGRSLVFVCEK